MSYLGDAASPGAAIWPGAAPLGVIFKMSAELRRDEGTLEGIVDRLRLGEGSTFILPVVGQIGKLIRQETKDGVIKGVNTRQLTWDVWEKFFYAVWAKIIALFFLPLWVLTVQLQNSNHIQNFLFCDEADHYLANNNNNNKNNNTILVEQ